MNEFGQVGDTAAVEQKTEKKEPLAVEKLAEDAVTKASGSDKTGTATKRK